MFICRKCNSSDMYMEKKNTNTGLYCKHCGAWQKWLSKDEIRVAELNNVPKFKPEPPKKNIEDYNSLFQDNDNPFKIDETSSFSNIEENEIIAEESQDESEEMVNLSIPKRLAEELLECLKNQIS